MKPSAVALGVLSLLASLLAVSPAAADPVDGYESAPCIANGGIGPDPFVDVSGAAFYADPVAWAYANGIVVGSDATHFLPDDSMTRGQFATVLHRAECLPTPTGDAPFTDLRVGAFYLDAVDWLVGEDLTTGITPERFGPDRTLSRGEFVTFLHRLVGTPTGFASSGFVDVDPEAYYADAVDWALYRGLTTGTTATTFSPDRALTRGEAVTFLYRLHTIGDVQARFTTLVSGLSSPTAMAQNPATGTWFIAEKGGRLLRWSGGATSTALDLTTEVSDGGERGLLGVAFTADGSKIYVSYTDRDGASNLVEHPMEGDALGASREILVVPQPASNHNGGDVKVGPDGYVYWALGDGGGSYDQYGNGQNTSSLLGSILRIDPANPAGGNAYSSPPDNPFAGDVPGYAQIWVYGVRNPWRFSFDPLNDDLWIADVGQGAREEVTRIRGNDVRLGANNLGWPLREGMIQTPGSVGGPAPADHVGPVHDYPLDAANRSITGGFVYRGDDVPALWGTYLYADFVGSTLMGWRDARGVENESIVGVGGRPTSFAQDADGEIYVVTFDGRFRKLVPA